MAVETASSKFALGYPATGKTIVPFVEAEVTDAVESRVIVVVVVVGLLG